MWAGTAFNLNSLFNQSPHISHLGCIFVSSKITRVHCSSSDFVFQLCFATRMWIREYIQECVCLTLLFAAYACTHTHTQQTTANSTAATHKEPAGSNLCSQHVNVIQRWGVVYVCVCVCVGMNVWVCLPLSVMTNRLKQRAESRPVAVLDVLFSLDSVNTCRLLPTVLIHPVTCCFAHLCL